MDHSRIFSFYLPQFHTIPENDLWYGKGFTDWENVKKASPLYPGHRQPRIPFDYYDLSNIQTIDNQVKRAKECGVDGFCFYYYNFGYNDELLTTPIENFLKIDTDFSFFMCWVNSDWRRTWDLSNTLLKKQNYSPNDIEYLCSKILTFAENKNYLFVNDKPLLVIYNISDISENILEKLQNKFTLFCIDHYKEDLTKYNISKISNRSFKLTKI